MNKFILIFLVLIPLSLQAHNQTFHLPFNIQATKYLSGFSQNQNNWKKGFRFQSKENLSLKFESTDQIRFILREPRSFHPSSFNQKGLLIEHKHKKHLQSYIQGIATFPKSINNLKGIIIPKNTTFYYKLKQQDYVFNLLYFTPFLEQSLEIKAITIQTGYINHILYPNRTYNIRYPYRSNFQIQVLPYLYFGKRKQRWKITPRQCGFQAIDQSGNIIDKKVVMYNKNIDSNNPSFPIRKFIQTYYLNLGNWDKKDRLQQYTLEVFCEDYNQKKSVFKTNITFK